MRILWPTFSEPIPFVNATSSVFAVLVAMHLLTCRQLGLVSREGKRDILYPYRRFRLNVEV